jgi:hypothetical protein
MLSCHLSMEKKDSEEILCSVPVTPTHRRRNNSCIIICPLRSQIDFALTDRLAGTA